MKIGVIIHSHTGNTLSVAQRLKDRLATSGHTVSLEQVTAVNGDPKEARNMELKDIPDVGSYDVVIFAAPVWGFSVSAVMKLYLSQLPSLESKKVGCFVTQHFPYRFLGGNNAIRQMKKACLSKGGNVYRTGVVNWTNKQREKIMEDVIESLSRV